MLKRGLKKCLHGQNRSESVRISRGKLFVAALLAVCFLMAAENIWVENFGNLPYQSDILVVSAKGKCTTHQWGAWTVKKAATCKKTGQEQRVCSVCKKKETRTIPKLANHQWGAWTVKKAATCKAAGQKQRVCSACKSKETQTIPKLANHQWGAWTVKKAATCKAAGQEQRICAACKSKETRTIAKTSHSGAWTVTKAATCTSTGLQTRKCTVCKAQETQTIAKLNHSFGGWTVTKAATCVANGTEVRTCSRCKTQESRATAKTGHAYATVFTVDKEATCTVAGSQSKHCTRPGCTAKTDVQTIAALGHDFSDSYVRDAVATCTAAGQESKHCTRPGCTAKSEVHPLAALGHSYAQAYTIDIEPTCTEDGLESKHCVRTRCYATTAQEVIECPGHVVEKWDFEREASCAIYGERRGKCSICGEQVKETTPALAHQLVQTERIETTCEVRGKQYSECSVCHQVFFSLLEAPSGHVFDEEYTTDKPATCTTPGIQSRHCTREGCNAVTDQKEIARLNGGIHQWGEELNTVSEATCTTPGIAKKTCTICGEESEPIRIPMLEHEWTDPVVEVAPTCTAKGREVITCQKCGERKETTLGVLGHNYTKLVRELQKASCDKTGVAIYQCSNDGCTATREFQTPASGHDFSGERQYRYGEAGASCGLSETAIKCTKCDAWSDYILEVGKAAHTWVKFGEPGYPYSDNQGIVCKVCKVHSPGSAGVDLLDENGNQLPNGEERTEAFNEKVTDPQERYGYRRVWGVLVRADLEKSEGFTDAQGNKVSWVYPTTIGNSNTLTLNAPAARHGFKFDHWTKNGKKISEVGQNQSITVKWEDMETEFEAVYVEDEAAKAASEPTADSAPIMQETPQMIAPARVESGEVQPDEAEAEETDPVQETVQAADQEDQLENHIVVEAPAENLENPQDESMDPGLSPETVNEAEMEIEHIVESMAHETESQNDADVMEKPAEEEEASAEVESIQADVVPLAGPAMAVSKTDAETEDRIPAGLIAVPIVAIAAAAALVARKRAAK